MRIDLSAPLRDSGQSYPFSADLELEPIVYLDDPVAFSNVHAEGVLIGAGESVEMRATVSADVTSRCALCLEEAKALLAAETVDRFSRTPNEDEDEYLIEGYSADLTKPVLDALLLEMPMRFLCRPDCKGLCPVCGQNRNNGSCTCEQDS